MNFQRIACVAANSQEARQARKLLAKRLGLVEPADADVIVALGGDGFMLQTIHAHLGLGVPIYGLNLGTVGFLMNAFREDGLRERLASAEAVTLYPLRMRALALDGREVDALAFNEVALIRSSQQSAKIRVTINDETQLDTLVCDGVMVATPAGSTAYNLSARGPIIPLGANVLALTPVSPFRPRRWQGALLPHTATVAFEVLEPDKRPVSVSADSRELRKVASVVVTEDRDVSARLLFDQGHTLEQRVIREQFAFG